MSQQFLSHAKNLTTFFSYTGNLTILNGALGELAPTLLLC
jgi:hypothetical protein